MNLLESLKRWTTVVADTGDIEAIAKYQPQDATTNPSLLYQAAQKPQYAHLVDDALHHAMHFPGDRAARTAEFMDELAVNFGWRSTSLFRDAFRPKWTHRSLRHEGAREGAQDHRLYEKAGIPRERILIELGRPGRASARRSTREGGHALQSDAPLLDAQAVACAEAKVTLISPFVGRIYDWYKKSRGDYSTAEDPGVESVTQIYNYYKKFGYKTEVMGASFRNIGDIVRALGLRPARPLAPTCCRSSPRPTASSRPAYGRTARRLPTHRDSHGRKDVPLDAKRRRYGERQAFGRHSQLQRRHAQVGEVRPGDAAPPGPRQGARPLNAGDGPKRTTQRQ